MEYPDQQPSSLPTHTIEEGTVRSPVRRFFHQLWIAKKWLFGLLAVIGLSAGVVVWMIFGRGGADQPAAVALTISSDTDVTSGSESEIAIVYENRHTQEARDILMEIIYPSNFRFISATAASRDGGGRSFDLPSLPAWGRGTLVVRGVFSGSPHEVQIIQGRLFYTPVNAKATFSVSAETKVSLRAPDFNLRIAAPSEVIPQQKIEYRTTFQNVTSKTAARIQLRLNFPDGFESISSSAQPVTPQSWEFSQVAAGEERSLTVVGRFSGAAGEEKMLRADLGLLEPGEGFVLQNSASFSLRVVESPLKLILQRTNGTGTLTPGEQAQFKLEYQNSGIRAFNNVQIGMKIHGTAFDRASVRAASGALLRDEVVWNGSSIPSLVLVQPGARGSLTLSLSVRNDFVAAAIKNPTLTLTPYFTSYELVDSIATPGLTLQVKSTVNVTTSVAAVSGAPLSYRIALRASSPFNDLREVLLEGVVNIPVVSLIEDSLQPDEQRSRFFYLPASGRVVWRIGDLPAFSTSEISFTLQTSGPPETFSHMLMRSLQVSAIDAFVGEAVVPVPVSSITLTRGQ